MPRLLLLLALCCLTACLLTACDPSTFFLLAPSIVKGGGSANGDPFEQPHDVDALRTEMINLINDERESRDLAPLTASSALHGIAQQHSTDMVTKDFLDHKGSDDSTPETRVKRNLGDWDYLGENVGAGFRTIAIAHAAFMKSEENKKNILASGATQIGVGVAFGNEDNEFKDGVYLTILFYDPK